ncbi:MAG TPA: superoxide dismutase [Steroidobacteraceae bacterium]|nr:superoxide dismutase [Steroidobacteraceae bacterium]
MPDVSRQTYPFSLPDLPYPYGSLDPHIDEATLRLHHDKHHKAYVDKLNDALAKEPELQKLPLIELLRGVDKLPEQVRAAVANNGGQHYNHDLFWNSLAPASGSSVPREPRGELGKAIAANFGSFAAFREKFSDQAVKHFASGWVALALERSGQLSILELHDQQVPKPWEATPIFIIDVWEHAYYVKYQNRRPEFVAAFWNVVDWDKAEERFSRGRSAAGV